jgi:hypothetical protein
MDYNIKINFLKFKNAEIVDSVKRGKVIVIPIEENEIYVTPQKSAAYINIRAREKDNDWQTHALRPKSSSGHAAFCGYMSEIPNSKSTKEPKKGNTKKDKEQKVSFDDFKGLPF